MKGGTSSTSEKPQQRPQWQKPCPHLQTPTGGGYSWELMKRVMMYLLRVILSGYRNNLLR